MRPLPWYPSQSCLGLQGREALAVGPMGQGDWAPAVSAGLSHLSSGILGQERHLRA